MSVIRKWIYAIPVDKATQELILETLRVAVLVAASAFLAIVVEMVAGLPKTTVTLVLLGLGRAADKWLFEKQQLARKRGEEAPVGIVGF